MPFELGKTKVDMTVVLSTPIAQFKDALLSYGVPDFDLRNPPWSGGFTQYPEPSIIFENVEKWMLDEHKIKLYTNDKRDLHAMLEGSIIPPGLIIEVNNDFQWTPGDFTDLPSIYWTKYRQAWPLLHKLGGAAVKVYLEDMGVARCLILPYGEDNSKPVLFNATGLPLEGIVSLYAAASGIEDGKVVVKWSGLSVDGRGGHPIPIADSGGYVIGVADTKPTDLSAQAYYIKRYNKYHLFCEKCYQRVAMEADGSYAPSHSYIEVVLCRECRAETKENGLPMRYSPNLAWQRTHRRIESNQATDNEPAPPPSSRSSFRWRGAYNYYFGGPNLALREHVPHMMSDPSILVRYLEDKASSMGIPIGMWTPTFDEGLALLHLDHLVDSTDWITRAFVNRAWHSITLAHLSYPNQVACTWLSCLWNGTAYRLKPLVFDNDFLHASMAEEILVHLGADAQAVSNMDDETVIELAAIAARDGYEAVREAISTYNEGDEDEG